MAGELTEEEMTNLAKAFKDLGVKPKFDSPAELQKWMKDYAKADDGEEEVLEGKQMITVVPQLPRVSTFSGDSSKGDTPFELWKYEVQCLLSSDSHPKGVITQAVRKSLKGEAGKIAMRLGSDATIERLLFKLEGVYGTVERSQSLLAEFYSAQQEEDEDVAAWSCRLEDLLHKAWGQGHVQLGGMDEMLRTKLWTGLRPSLKDRSSHKFDICQSFDELRIELRIVEHECALRKKATPKDLKRQAHVNSAIPTTGNDAPQDEMKELKGLVYKLTAKVDSLQEQMNANKHNQVSAPPQPTSKSHPYSAHNQGRATSAPNQGRSTPAHNQRRATGHDQWRPASGYDQWGASNFQEGQPETYNPQEEDDEPLCWRCGTYGHLKHGCRVNLARSRKPLNTHQSTHGGGW